ncbi:MAG TPA: hypothetical protein VG013_05685 [Gemmataceae bacterium]|jgi:hypothetical protein|nr:hypothetical protein [Gemmataceae bacterium]
MRKFLLGTLAFGLVLGLAHRALAEDTAQAIIDKAIKAHGGAKKLSTVRGIQAKTKGKIEIAGGLEFTQETSLQPPDKFKEVLDLEVKGQNVTVTTVFDGKKAWVNANGTTTELEDKFVAEFKEVAHLTRVSRLTTLKDKSFKLSPLGEVKVNDRPAVGIKVSSKGHKDISLYFDKKTGLVAKTERRTLDAMTKAEVTEERIVTEYQDVDGSKVAKNVIVNHDGKKFLEAEVTEVKFVDKIDDSEFDKP